MSSTLKKKTIILFLLGICAVALFTWQNISLKPPTNSIEFILSIIIVLLATILFFAALFAKKFINSRRCLFYATYILVAWLLCGTIFEGIRLFSNFSFNSLTLEKVLPMGMQLLLTLFYLASALVYTKACVYDDKTKLFTIAFLLGAVATLAVSIVSVYFLNGAKMLHLPLLGFFNVVVYFSSFSAPSVTAKRNTAITSALWVAVIYTFTLYLNHTFLTMPLCLVAFAGLFLAQNAFYRNEILSNIMWITILVLSVVCAVMMFASDYSGMVLLVKNFTLELNQFIQVAKYLMVHLFNILVFLLALIVPTLTAKVSKEEK